MSGENSQDPPEQSGASGHGSAPDAPDDLNGIDAGAPLSPEQRKAACLERRAFLERLAMVASGITFAGILTPISIYLWPASKRQGTSGEPVLVAKADEVKVGEAKSVMFAGEPVLVIHTKGGWIGLKATCPHLGCVARWEKLRQGIVCPCHGAVFSPQGQVLSGPAPKPLAAVNVRQVGEQIYIG